MPYSEVIRGEVLDYRFKKRKTDTLVYIGDIFLGQLFKLRSGWSAVGTGKSKYLNSVDGFKTRYGATEYLMIISGIRGKQYD